MEYGKRKPVMKRKPSVMIAIGMPKPTSKAAMPEAPDDEDDSADESLTCPKCGAELADTPENRDYAAARDAEMDESDEMDEDESED